MSLFVLVCFWFKCRFVNATFGVLPRNCNKYFRVQRSFLLCVQFYCKKTVSVKKFVTTILIIVSMKKHPLYLYGHWLKIWTKIHKNVFLWKTLTMQWPFMTAMKKLTWWHCGNEEA